MLPRAVNLFAGNGAVGFGVTGGVVPGGPPVTITLRPPGRVRLLVRGPDAVPVADAYARVTQVEGVNVMSFARIAGSDAQGIAEGVVPAGQIELLVSKEDAEARLSLEVPEGGSVSAEVTLAPAPPGGVP
jgi:hypothetical protein